jgi:putative transposase
VSAFIDEHRERFGVEPICETLDVSASAYYQRATGERSARSVEDERLTARVREVHEQNFECYGYPRCGTSCSARASRSAATTLPV